MNPSRAVEISVKFWDGIADCRNKHSHPQGSLYNISRKLNLKQDVSRRAPRRLLRSRGVQGRGFAHAGSARGVRQR